MTAEPQSLPDVMMPVVRPNGKLYRPRRIVAYVVGEEDESVLVLGTHDVARAQILADRVAQQLVSGCVAAEPCTGWYRDGIVCGERRWVSDEVRGRAGVWFRSIVEASDAS